MKNKTKIVIAIITAIGTAIAGYSVATISNNINNEVVINVRGEAVDVNKSNADDLQNIIDNLEQEKKDLTEKNGKLSSEIQNAVTANLKNVKLIIDGIDTGINSKDSVAVINNKNYYSESFVNGLIGNKDFNIDFDSNKAYIGDKKVESTKLFDICPTPVVSDGYYVNILSESINMSSEPYYEGFSVSSSNRYDEEYAIFNIKGEYKDLKFLVGHIDETQMSSGTLKIYLSDDNGKFNKSPVKTITINPEDLPQEINIELNYAKQVKFEMTTNDRSASWGFVDLYLD